MKPFETVQVIPQTILLDTSGKIIWSSFDINTDTWVETLLRAIEKK